MVRKIQYSRISFNQVKPSKSFHKSLTINKQFFKVWRYIWVFLFIVLWEFVTVVTVLCKFKYHILSLCYLKSYYEHRRVRGFIQGNPPPHEFHSQPTKAFASSSHPWFCELWFWLCIIFWLWAHPSTDTLRFLTSQYIISVPTHQIIIFCSLINNSIAHWH